MGLRSYKVLVIDDSVDHQFLYQAMLQRASGGSFTVVSAGNAGAGLTACQQERPDCILLDLNLPDVGGLVLLEALRDASGQLPCAIVIITAHGSERVAVDAMKRGAHDYLVKGQIDTGSLSHAIVNAIDKVFKQRQQEEDQARLSHQALHDSLTGLANRRHFEPRVVHALELAKRTESRVALLAMDLDGFKALNDEFGHHAGDEVLLQVATRMRKMLRVTDTVARLGGDEFAVLMEGHPSNKSALVVANKIVEAVNLPICVTGKSVYVGGSIGIAHSTNDVDATTLTRRADSAMYVAKRSGRHVVEFNHRKMAWPTAPSARQASRVGARHTPQAA